MKYKLFFIKHHKGRRPYGKVQGATVSTMYKKLEWKFLAMK